MWWVPEERPPLARFGRVTRWAVGWQRGRSGVGRVFVCITAALVLVILYSLLVPWCLLRLVGGFGRIIGRNDVRMIRSIARGVQR